MGALQVTALLRQFFTIFVYHVTILTKCIQTLGNSIWYLKIYRLNVSFKALYYKFSIMQDDHKYIVCWFTKCIR